MNFKGKVVGYEFDKKLCRIGKIVKYNKGFKK